MKQKVLVTAVTTVVRDFCCQNAGPLASLNHAMDYGTWCPKDLYYTDYAIIKTTTPTHPTGWCVYLFALLRKWELPRWCSNKSEVVSKHYCLKVYTSSLADSNQIYKQLHIKSWVSRTPIAVQHEFHNDKEESEAFVLLRNTNLKENIDIV